MARGTGESESVERPERRLSWRSVAARGLLSAGYRAGLLAAACGRRFKPRDVRRVLVTGTFHNPNWYRAHLRPLAACRLDELVVVTDDPPPPIDGVEVVCPPSSLRRRFGRNVAKLLVLLREARRRRPDVVMGYHLFPGALTALMAARCCGAAAVYQMTAGPIEILGGGVQAENRVMSALRRPSARIERLALRLARSFDALVVRGRRAQAYLRSRGVSAPICIIPGSVQPPRRQPPGYDARDLDLLWLGRLAEIKRPEVFVELVTRLARHRPGLRAAILGDGELFDPLADVLRRNGIDARIQMPGKVDPVEPWLIRARVFVLTSRNEGLSIALGEAMRAGCVPVVSDVGELRDLVHDGRNGYVVGCDDLDGFVRAATRALQDPAHWRRLSQQAAHDACALMDVAHIAQRWQACFGQLAARPQVRTQPASPRPYGRTTNGPAHEPPVTAERTLSLPQESAHDVASG